MPGSAAPGAWPDRAGAASLPAAAPAPPATASGRVEAVWSDVEAAWSDVEAAWSGEERVDARPPCPTVHPDTTSPMATAATATLVGGKVFASPVEPYPPRREGTTTRDGGMVDQER
jgi:hypothetical protein